MNINKPINSVFIFKAGTSEKMKEKSQVKRSAADVRKKAEMFRKHLGK